MALDEILLKYFNCKNPYLKNRKIAGYYTGGGEREPDYEYLTVAGGKAYGKLTDLLYDLRQLLGEGFKADHWVNQLDEIVQGEH